MKKNLYFILFISCFIVIQSKAQDIFKGYAHLFTPPLHYTAYQIKDSLRIDGKMNEPAWGKAPWSAYFLDIEGDAKPRPAHATRFKMLWNTTHLYIAAEMEEPHIWATLTQHDQIIYHDNDFEIFIDPDDDTHDYFEIEVNALNTIFDLFLSRPYRNGGHLSTAWNAGGLQSAVYINGTLNNPGDTDKKWTVEMAIPFGALQKDNAAPEVKAGDRWRINFSRVQWDTEIVDGKYKKKINPATGKPFPEHNWVWSPQGVINMHYPERWGYLWFAAEDAKKEKEAYGLPPSEDAKKYLWLIYYKQKQYRQSHGKYADNLSQLQLPSVITVKPGNECTLQLTAVEKQFTATVTCDAGREGWQIDQNGRLTHIR
ncbi:carbohydrate-binding family 9-like protein [Agriterribacter sp.]|uniref:carbohydrate-binding family 9-like protein n=1 Tax=Agriterribacter sp. TaxID=2821509 RepID=UPI002BB2C0E4|nr:carbohydrate-binding family 9-like protein [Agriterribacter sp.]HRO44432.1 carbohydrate-binding family 9-like protein [Agriterribacter sp.]HRQ19219.1 carbohydrate-binding family 9-like protein [Agriterribacter sp.]